MRGWPLAVLFVILFSSDCAPVASSEQRAVKDVALAHLNAQGYDQIIGPRTLKIEEEEIESVSTVSECLSGAGDVVELATAFIDVNSTQRYWTTGGAFRSLGRIGSGGDHDDLPRDHLEISLPSIDEEAGRALVYVERHCPLCGFGQYQLLVRERGRWSVKDDCYVWLS